MRARRASPPCSRWRRDARRGGSSRRTAIPARVTDGGGRGRDMVREILPIWTGVAFKLGRIPDRADGGDLRVTQFSCRWRDVVPTLPGLLFRPGSDPPPAVV